jgi:hypothetical protein
VHVDSDRGRVGQVPSELEPDPLPQNVIRHARASEIAPETIDQRLSGAFDPSVQRLHVAPPLQVPVLVDAWSTP